MARRWAAALLVLLLPACEAALGAEPPRHATDLVGVERGRRVYHVWCNEDVADCWRDAQAACHGEYEVKERNIATNKRGRLRDGDLLVRCAKPQ